jgi:hypothetical protein
MRDGGLTQGKLRVIFVKKQRMTTVKTDALSTVEIYVFIQCAI